MSRSIVAKRYAKALFEVAQEQQMVEVVERELSLVAQLMTDDLDFRKFLQHPNIDNGRKLELLETVFAQHVSPIVMQTLRLIIARGREAIIHSLLEYYKAIANEALGQEDAIIYSANDLPGDEFAHIVQTFSTLTGKKIKATHVVDPTILGGLRVRIGDHSYDGSLASKLDKLEKALLA